MPNKLRIMHFTYALDGGGAERQLVYLLDSIDTSSCQNAVCSVQAQGQTQVKQSIDFFEVPRSYKWDLRWGRIRKVIADWKPDIVHVWKPYVLASSMPALLNSGVKALISSYRSAYRLDRTINFVQVICLLFVHKIVSNISVEDMRTPFRQLFQLKNGEVIPNGFDFDLIRSAAQIDWKLMGIDSSPHKILYVGRLVSEKNVCELLEALSLINQENLVGCQLIICGEGIEQASLQESARTLGISDRVFFLGYRQDVYRFMKSCDLLVIPSFREGMPNVLFEAMAAKIPVIASDIPTHRRWVEDGINGFLFNPGNPEQLAGCIQEALNYDQKAILRLTENASTLAYDYSVERMVKSYESLYQRMAHGASTV